MESFAALFEESLQRQEMRAGEVITAEVMRVDNNFVVVNAGLKSESYIAIEEFRTDRGELTVAPGDYVSVYVPTTPNPTGGYFVMVRKSACVELQMSVDEALTYIVSMGVIVPGGPKNPHLKVGADGAIQKTP